MRWGQVAQETYLAIVEAQRHGQEWRCREIIADAIEREVAREPLRAERAFGRKIVRWLVAGFTVHRSPIAGTDVYVFERDGVRISVRGDQIHRRSVPGPQLARAMRAADAVDGMARVLEEADRAAASVAESSRLIARAFGEEGGGDG